MTTKATNPNEHLSLRMLFAEFIDSIRETRSHFTVENFTTNLRRIRRYSSYGATLCDLTPNTLDVMCKEMARRYSPATIRVTIEHLHTFLSWCQSQQLIDQNPLHVYGRHRSITHPPGGGWTKDEFARVVAACDALNGVTVRDGDPVPLRVYFGCIVRMVAETSLQKRHIFGLTQKHVANNRTITRRTRELFESLPGRHPLYWRNKRSFYGRWELICEAAGVPYGAIETIRKTVPTLRRPNPERSTS